MEIEMRVTIWLLVALALVGARTSQAASLEDDLGPAARSVEACYNERMYRSAVQGLSPMRFEIAIRNECSDYEAPLKALYNKSSQKSVLRNLREKSVVKYFDALRRLRPRFDGLCPDKKYSCIISQR